MREFRSIPPALRRALNSRDQGCCFPGCTQTRYVDGHHIQHSADGGETKLANLVSLCRFHHRQVHEGGFTVQRLDDGAWRFTRANGPFTDTFDSVAPGHSAVRGDWRGETMDFGQAMMVLVQRAEMAGTFPRKRTELPGGGG